MTWPIWSVTDVSGLDVNAALAAVAWSASPPIFCTIESVSDSRSAALDEDAVEAVVADVCSTHCALDRDVADGDRDAAGVDTASASCADLRSTDCGVLSPGGLVLGLAVGRRQPYGDALAYRGGSSMTTGPAARRYLGALAMTRLLGDRHLLGVGAGAHLDRRHGRGVRALVDLGRGNGRLDGVVCGRGAAGGWRSTCSSARPRYVVLAVPPAELAMAAGAIAAARAATPITVVRPAPVARGDRLAGHHARRRTWPYLMTMHQ